MKKLVMVVVLVAMPALASLPSPIFQPGDIVVASGDPACAIDPPPPASDQVDMHGRDAGRVRPLTNALISAAMYDDNGGGIYVADAKAISLLAPWGNLYPVLQVPEAHTLTAMTTIGGVDLLAVVYTNGDATPELWRFDHVGRTVGRDPLPQYDHFIRSIDVASDQCTVFYAVDDSIERFDVCAHTPLARFASLLATHVRVLPDHGVLVASGNELVRLDAAGNPIATFPVPDGIGALTLDETGRGAWIVTTSGCIVGQGQLFELELAMGNVIAGPEPIARSNGFVLVLQGEWHASVNKPPARRRSVH